MTIDTTAERSRLPAWEIAFFNREGYLVPARSVFEPAKLGSHRRRRKLAPRRAR